MSMQCQSALEDTSPCQIVAFWTWLHLASVQRCSSHIRRWHAAVRLLHCLTTTLYTLLKSTVQTGQLPPDAASRICRLPCSAQLRDGNQLQISPARHGCAGRICSMARALCHHDALLRVGRSPGGTHCSPALPAEVAHTAPAEGPAKVLPPVELSYNAAGQHVRMNNAAAPTPDVDAHARTKFRCSTQMLLKRQMWLFATLNAKLSWLRITLACAPD